MAICSEFGAKKEVRPPPAEYAQSFALELLDEYRKQVHLAVQNCVGDDLPVTGRRAVRRCPTCCFPFLPPS